MSLRAQPLLQLLFAAAAAGLLAFGLATQFSPRSEHRADGAGATTKETPGRARRIVSLSPGMTEVLVAIGRGSQLVGVSDYCVLPPEFASLPRLGTALTPNFEGILSAAPDLILTQEARDTPVGELGALAPTLSLPWHTTTDLILGIGELGRVTEAIEAAQALATEVDRTLRSNAPPANAPKVLFVLEHSAGQLTEAWYVKDDTIHGDALRAAGFQNVIPAGEAGVPRISLERVVALDPDAIFVLSTRESLPAAEEAQLLEDWHQLTTLRAVRNGMVAVVTGDRLYVTGPRVLALVAAIRKASRQVDLGGGQP